MGDQTALPVVHRWMNAWTAGDLTAGARYLADDLVFDGPIHHVTSASAFLASFARFITTVTGPVQMIAELGDAEQALIMYDLPTDQYGTLRVAEHFTVRDGKISANKVCSMPVDPAQAAALHGLPTTNI